MTNVKEDPVAAQFGRFEMLPVNILNSDGTYQRAVSAWRVNDIVFNYMPPLFQPLTIGLRKGVYYVIDGQHRRDAAIKLGFSKVPCMVYDTKTVAEEAKLFLLLQDKRRVISYPQKFIARIAMREPAAIAISELLTKYGFEIDKYDSFQLTKQNNVIMAVASLQYAYDIGGEKLVENLLYVLRNAWDGKADSLNLYIIRGLTSFMHEYKAFNRSSLAKKLSVISASDISRGARTVMNRYGMEEIDATAYVIRNIDLNQSLTARQETEVE